MEQRNEAQRLGIGEGRDGEGQKFAQGKSGAKISQKGMCCAKLSHKGGCCASVVRKFIIPVVLQDREHGFEILSQKRIRTRDVLCENFAQQEVLCENCRVLVFLPCFPFFSP